MTEPRVRQRRKRTKNKRQQRCLPDKKKRRSLRPSVRQTTRRTIRELSSKHKRCSSQLRRMPRSQLNPSFQRCLASKITSASHLKLSPMLSLFSTASSALSSRSKLNYRRKLKERKRMTYRQSNKRIRQLLIFTAQLRTKLLQTQ